MLYLSKNILIILLLTLTLQANDKVTYTKVMELGLKQVSSIPAIMKNYVMVEMKNTFSDPVSELNAESANFTTLQKELSLLAVDEQTGQTIVKQQELWHKVELVLAEPITRKGFKKLKTCLLPLRKSIKKMIKTAKEQASGELCNCIFYTGKLSASSQKFASLYMLLKWGGKS